MTATFKILDVPVTIHHEGASVVATCDNHLVVRVPRVYGTEDVTVHVLHWHLHSGRWLLKLRRGFSTASQSSVMYYAVHELDAPVVYVDRKERTVSYTAFGVTRKVPFKDFFGVPCGLWPPGVTTASFVEQRKIPVAAQTRVTAPKGMSPGALQALQRLTLALYDEPAEWFTTLVIWLNNREIRIPFYRRKNGRPERILHEFKRLCESIYSSDSDSLLDQDVLLSELAEPALAPTSAKRRSLRGVPRQRAVRLFYDVFYTCYYDTEDMFTKYTTEFHGNRTAYKRKQYVIRVQSNQAVHGSSAV